jgi:hypothetical protein
MPQPAQHPDGEPESAAVGDFNNDGKLDVTSYEADP